MKNTITNKYHVKKLLRQAKEMKETYQILYEESREPEDKAMLETYTKLCKDLAISVKGIGD